MKNLQRGNKVEIMTGKNQGQIGKIVSIEPNGRVLVQIPGLQYERSYDKDHLKFHDRGDESLFSTSGEARRKKMQALVREGKICPSFPHQCSGECDAAKSNS